MPREDEAITPAYSGIILHKIKKKSLEDKKSGDYFFVFSFR